MLLIRPKRSLYACLKGRCQENTLFFEKKRGFEARYEGREGKKGALSIEGRGCQRILNTRAQTVNMAMRQRTGL